MLLFLSYLWSCDAILFWLMLKTLTSISSGQSESWLTWEQHSVPLDILKCWWCLALTRRASRWRRWRAEPTAGCLTYSHSSRQELRTVPELILPCPRMVPAVTVAGWNLFRWCARVLWRSCCLVVIRRHTKTQSGGGGESWDRWMGRGSVGRASDRHAADASSIPRCGKGFSSRSQLSVQTLFWCPYTPVCNRMH